MLPHHSFQSFRVGLESSMSPAGKDSNGCGSEEFTPSHSHGWSQVKHIQQCRFSDMLLNSTTHSRLACARESPDPDRSQVQARSTWTSRNPGNRSEDKVNAPLNIQRETQKPKD